MQVKNKETAQKILDYINDCLAKGNTTPSMYDMADELGFSVATVSRYVNYLEEKGLITRNGRKSISTAKSEKAKKETVECAIVGDIACGTPLLAEENIESYVTLSKEFLGAGKFYILHAHGDSMINAGINDGDLVVIKQQETAFEGQIIVALIDGEATLKRYYIDKRRRKIRLHPENDNMEDMFFSSIQIQGIAVKVIKDLS
jgi:repressor LexA